MKALYEFPKEQQQRFIEGHINQGKISGRMEGAFGEVFFFDHGTVAKCPKINRYGNPADAREALEKSIYEIEQTYKCARHPLVHRFAPPKLVLGWPFYCSRMRDGTLNYLIKEPNRWNCLQKIAALVQISHALNYCRSVGVIAHQDLKPDNILIQNLPTDEIDPKSVAGFTTVMHISDFGVADAFRHIGRNTGSRPYMAPEQYEPGLLVDGSKIDVFALAVIAFECFTDGFHPIGEVTTDVWPDPIVGKPSRWKQERVWKKWATGQKDLTRLSKTSEIPSRLVDAISRCLNPDPTARPAMEDFENEFWKTLIAADQNWAKGVRMQIDDLDNYAPAGEEFEWPAMDECIHDLRIFYAHTRSPKRPS